MLNDLLAKNQSSDKLYVEDVFSTYLYTGNDSTQTITNGIDLAGKGGMVWIKPRDLAEFHSLFDTSRGAGYYLSSSQTSAQTYGSTTLTAFNSNGFSLGGATRVNGSPWNNASWTFRKAPKFFDVLTYTGTGSTQSINHNLGVAPGLILIKRTDGPSDWSVFHRSSGSGKVLFFNTTAAEVTSSSYWNNTNPTSTQFTLGSGGANNNSGQTYVAYLFAHDTTADGVIQCGSITTDASGISSVVNLGWEPQYILLKRSDGTQNWLVFDTMRGMSLSSTADLYPNLSNAENLVTPQRITLTPTGFQIAGTLSASATYIYLAIRRGPMRVPTDATKVYTAVQYTASAVGTKVTNNFPSDWSWLSRYQLSGGQRMFTRLTNNLDVPYSAGSETVVTSNGVGFDSNTQITDNYIYYNWGTSTPAFQYAFRRAPGFFDVTCYSGTGATLSVKHNLGVVPELIILKRRDTAANWPVWRTATGTGTTFGYLNDSGAEADQGVSILTASPTSSAFSVGAWGPINASGGTYVAYLFATCPGVSKVGTYTGTGTTQQINCGFTNGARFILIKRTNGTGDWYLYDSTRGISAGNDPYLLLNSTAAEVTNTDYIDPLSTGFELSSTAPAALNANGGTYIYLAIA